MSSMMLLAQPCLPVSSLIQLSGRTALWNYKKEVMKAVGVTWIPFEGQVSGICW